MKKLEDELGVKLFVRENKKISLNETGKLAAALAQSQVNQNREMISRIIEFDRSLRSIHIGSCAPQPMAELMPILQDYFGDMTISSELVYGGKLLKGLKTGVYHLAILREAIEDKELFVPMTKEQQAEHDELKYVIAQLIAKWKHLHFLSYAILLRLCRYR